jgi:hypothetical protein
MDRERVLEPLISSIRRGTAFSRYDIVKALETWEAVPVLLEGEHVGSAIVNGTEIHFALVPDWRPGASMRGRIREFLTPLLERRGFLTTRVRHERPAEKQFVQRVGFKSTWKDAQFEYYLLGCLPFERKTQ